MELHASFVPHLVVTILIPQWCAISVKDVTAFVLPTIPCDRPLLVCVDYSFSTLPKNVHSVLPPHGQLKSPTRNETYKHVSTTCHRPRPSLLNSRRILLLPSVKLPPGLLIFLLILFAHVMASNWVNGAGSPYRSNLRLSVLTIVAILRGRPLSVSMVRAVPVVLGIILVDCEIGLEDHA